jgi:radical SAM family protein/iron-sulfur cluster protein
MAKDIEIEPFGDGAEAGYDVRIRHIRYGMSPSHFDGELDLATKKALFKRYVNRITLEVSSYCNRVCVFCPNKTGIRRKQSQLEENFEPRLMDSILESLKSIEYENGIILHLYNEPMADPALPSKVAKIAQALPKAVIWTNTNGDYLTRESLYELMRAGMHKLEVSLYGPGDGENYDHGYLSRAFQRVFGIVGQDAEVTQQNGQDMRARIVLKEGDRRLQITIFASDFNSVGYDRGKSLSDVPTWRRSTPCSSVFNEFNVGWDGSVVPCCNIHPNDPQHSKFIIGRLETGDDIFHLYHSTALREWRKNLAKFGPSLSPCDTCTRGDFPELNGTDEATSVNRAVEDMFRGSKT